jgi:hypothetical protein
MFKGFSSRQGFNGVPNSNFGMNNRVYEVDQCRYWFDAATLSGLALNAAVSLWVDKMRNVQASQTTAGNQPRFIPSNVPFNNNPTVEFFDTARRLLLPVNLLSNSKFTIAAVANMNSINLLNVVMSGASAVSQFGVGGTAATVTGVFAGSGAAGSSTLLQGVTEFTTPRIIIFTNSNLVVDRVLEDSGKSLIPFTANTLGGRDNNTAFGLNGNIAEILFWDVEISVDKMYELSDILNTKYAIY